jgi:hypothetical protein
VGLLAALAAFAALWLCATRPGRWARRALPVALVGIGFAAAQDFLRPGVSEGHDIRSHLWALWALWKAVLDGDFWPRWTQRLGLGMPLLQFYPPLSYVLAWPAQAFGASPAQAATWLAVLGQTASAASAFACARWLSAPAPTAAVAAVAYCFAPYHLIDTNIRWALGESMAFPWWPALFSGVVRLATGYRDRQTTGIVAVSVAGLLMTHLLSAVMAGIAVPLVWGLVRFGSRTRPATGAAFTAVVVAAGMTAFQWLPMMAEIDETSVSRLTSGSIARMGLAPFELLRRRAMPDYGIRRAIGDIPDPGADMPIYFGLALLALAIVASFPRPTEPAAAATKPTADGAPSVQPAPLTIAACVLLALATWPVSLALDLAPPLRTLQFPWRLLAPATALAALAVGIGLGQARNNLRAGTVLALSAIWLDSLPFLGSASRWAAWDGLATVDRFAARPIAGIPRDRFVRLENLDVPPSTYDWDVALSRRLFPEYLTPRIRDAYGKQSKPPSRETSERFGASYRVHDRRHEVEQLRPEPLVSFAGSGRAWPIRWQPERVVIELPAGESAGRLRVTAMAFPGWRVRIDGGPRKPALDDEGLLAVDVAAGSRQVEFEYAAFWPWDRAAGAAISVLTATCLVMTLRRRRSHDPAGRPSPRGG